MNTIYWKRGVPTEEECREWTIVDGGERDIPSPIDVHGPGETYTGDWTEGWYAAVRILPPEQETPAEGPEELCPITGLPERVIKSAVSDIQKSLSKSQETAEPAIRESRTVEKTEGPQPGQFWENEEGKRRHIIGMKSNGIPVVEFDYGDMLAYSVEYITTRWKHLPWCKSFTDVPPKKTKTQRKWVARFDTWHWFDIDSLPDKPTVNAEMIWEPTDDVREVPL